MIVTRFGMMMCMMDMGMMTTECGGDLRISGGEKGKIGKIKIGR